MILIGAILMLVGAYFFLLRLFIGEILLSVSDSVLYAPQASLFTELFNRKYRFTASNFSYQIASIIGGSIARLPLHFHFTHFMFNHDLV